jgi:hypothetical protein
MGDLLLHDVYRGVAAEVDRPARASIHMPAAQGSGNGDSARETLDFVSCMGHNLTKFSSQWWCKAVISLLAERQSSLG